MKVYLQFVQLETHLCCGLCTPFMCAHQEFKSTGFHSHKKIKFSKIVYNGLNKGHISQTENLEIIIQLLTPIKVFTSSVKYTLALIYRNFTLTDIILCYS